MEPEFIRGTVAIDLQGGVTAVLYCDGKKVKIDVHIPPGALGDFAAYDHQRIWRAYQSVQDRIEGIVKEKCSGLPAESCKITLEKPDLAIKH